MTADETYRAAIRALDIALDAMRDAKTSDAYCAAKAAYQDASYALQRLRGNT